MASVKDLRLNPPTKKTELSKQSMLNYVKEGTVEEKRWFYDLMDKNRIKKKNNLKGTVVDGYDMPKIREEFAKKFFPDISSKAKRDGKAKKPAKTFEDELKALLD